METLVLLAASDSPSGPVLLLIAGCVVIGLVAGWCHKTPSRAVSRTIVHDVHIRPKNDGNEFLGCLFFGVIGVIAFSLIWKYVLAAVLIIAALIAIVSFAFSD